VGKAADLREQEAQSLEAIQKGLEGSGFWKCFPLPLRREPWNSSAQNRYHALKQDVAHSFVLSAELHSFITLTLENLCHNLKLHNDYDKPKAFKNLFLYVEG
jgi:hypothetical protein